MSNDRLKTIGQIGLAVGAAYLIAWLYFLGFIIETVSYIFGLIAAPFVFIYGLIIKPPLFFLGFMMPPKPPPPPPPESSLVSTYLYCPNPRIEGAFFGIEIAKKPEMSMNEEWNDEPKKGRFDLDKDCEWNGIFSNDNNCKWRKNLYEYNNDFYQYSENFDELSLSHTKVYVAFEDPTKKLRQIESQIQLLDSGSSKIGILGINVSDLEGGAWVKKGVLIDKVRVGSAAEDAGFKPGDRISEVNDYAIANVKELRDAIDFSQAGEEFKIKIVSGEMGTVRELSVKLREQEIVCIGNDCFDYYLDVTQQWLDFLTKKRRFIGGKNLKFIYESYYEVGGFSPGARLIEGLRPNLQVSSIPNEDGLYIKRT